jgi:OmpA-OmpF porin, OOP family
MKKTLITAQKKQFKKAAKAYRYNRLAQTIGLTAMLASPLVFSQNGEPTDDGFNFRAEPSHWYIGGNYGRTVESIDDGEIANTIIGGGLTGMEDDDSDRGYKFFVGYQFNHYLAVEAGYVDLGDFGVRVARDPDVGTLTSDTSYKGYNLDVVGTWPMTQRLSAFGRVGAFHYQTEENFIGTQSLAASLSRDDKDTGYKFGAGLEYSFTDRLSARVEAERYRIEDMLGDNGSVNLYSVGLVYRFGDRATPPPPSEQAPVVAQQEYCSNMQIYFDINRADLPRAESERLYAAGAFLKKYPDTKAVIHGHTDNVGSNQYNMQLSQRRAESVLQYLVDQQIDASRISTIARGEEDPASTNETEEGKRENRRVNATIDCVKDVAGVSLPEARITIAALVEFDQNSVTVDDQYHSDLEKAAQYLRDNPKVTAHIEGHAADITSTSKAQEISERRAANVLDYLVEKFGVERSRLTAEGFGKLRRVAYNTTEAGRQQNRRVNIVLHYPR